MDRLIAFGLISLALAYISRASLAEKSKPHSHGFYRFFAWESIAALILLNLPAWLRSPLAWHQVVSWVLLAGSLLPLALGVQALIRLGRPADRRAGQPHLLAFEKTSSLVTSGIYRYIRHPLYTSLLLLAWGTYFKQPLSPGILLALAATAFLVATAKADEAECLAFFGPDYASYMQSSRRFVPFVV